MVEITTAPRLPRRTPLALRNVTHEKYKSLTAIAGICFANILILMQLGFLEVVKITATNLFSKLRFDAVLVSRTYEQFFDAGTIPKERLIQARGVEGVVDANPFYASMALWRCPPIPISPDAENVGVWDSLLSSTGFGTEDKPVRLRGLLVLGIELDDIPFFDPIQSQVVDHLPFLRQPGRVLLDEWSHPDFGWKVRDQFHDWELGRRRVDIVGGFTLGTGFGADATVLCSDANYVTFCRGASLDRITLGLLTVVGRSPVEVVKELAARMPADTLVFTREELMSKEQRHWVRNTATGVLFGFGVFVAVCVGTVVVYQVLSNDVANHYAEYATLKAIGYTNRFLAGVVTTQALLYAISAFLPALFLSVGLYRLTEMIANIPMKLTLFNVLLVLALSVIMCLVSALLTLRRVRLTDPADLF
ncbi:MAG: FtsX-like permease family protein [Planctomycetota bacterium]